MLSMACAIAQLPPLSAMHVILLYCYDVCVSSQNVYR